jgi:hypothetical protein
LQPSSPTPQEQEQELICFVHDQESDQADRLRSQKSFCNAAPTIARARARADMFRPRPRQRSSRPLGITKKLKKLLSNKLQEANNKGTNKHTNNMVRHVERGMEEWSELMEESKTKFVVVDFAASW